MKAQSDYVRLVLVAALVFLAPCLWAQDGLKGALSRAEIAEPFAGTLAVADLDGDKKPDGAVLFDFAGLHSGSRRIQLHFSDRPDTEFAFESMEQALTLTAWDIDNDGDTDLVVEEFFTHKPLHVWINEGHGDFREGRVSDLPSVDLRPRQNLQAPSKPAGGLVLCLPSQRGFEIAILTVPQLGRPTLGSRRHVISPHSWSLSHAQALNSSRAPPLS